jgi:cyclohexyl-isocyanide hydratase
VKFAFIVYDGLTLLDFAGVYDPITRLKTMGFMESLNYSVCAMKQTVRTIEGLQITVDQVGGRLGGYDYIFIPGGNGVSVLISDMTFMRWIKSAASHTIMTAVCGGTLVLGAAGFIKDKRATTHPALKQYLARFTAHSSDERIVDEGSVITARGVTSAIDLGLYLCEKIAGKDIRKTIQKQMDYNAYGCK